MFEYDGRKYIERDDVKTGVLADYRARVALGESPSTAIDAAYSAGVEKDKALDEEESDIVAATQQEEG